MAFVVVQHLDPSHRLPIDGVLRSLAEDQAENAAGTILSGTGTGTGSDGTLGLRAMPQ